MSAIEDLQAALAAGFKVRQEGVVLSDPDGSLVQLARAFIPRHLRPTEWGIEDVESHWRDLPEVDRQAILDQMHAPAAPELQTGDRPETRPLRDLPPGLQAVYRAVKQNVGERKYAALQAKVEAGGGNPYERQAGYLKRLPTSPEEPDPVVYPDPGNQPYSDPDDPGNQPGGNLPTAPAFQAGDRVSTTDPDGTIRSGTVTDYSGYGSYVVDLQGEIRQVDEGDITPLVDEEGSIRRFPIDLDGRSRETLDELLGADVIGPETVAEAQAQIGTEDLVETLAELVRTDLVDEETLLDNDLLTSEELANIRHYATVRAEARARGPRLAPPQYEQTRAQYYERLGRMLKQEP